MTNIHPTESFAGIGAGQPSQQRRLGSDLGQEDFLKLLTVELSTQDPLDPKKDSEFISQIMQISSLEQAKATQEDIAAMRYEQRLLQANAMLGQEVDLDHDGKAQSGAVSEVRLEDGVPKLVVSGKTYDFAQVMAIAMPAGNTELINPLNRDEHYA